MITVTFPTGVRVTYNDANFVQWYTDRLEVLHKDDNGKLFYRAAAPMQTGCLVEWKKPCEVTAPPLPSAETALDRLLELSREGKLRECISWKVRQLKRALQAFNARSGVWR